MKNPENLKTCKKCRKPEILKIPKKNPENPENHRILAIRKKPKNYVFCCMESSTKKTTSKNWYTP